MSASVNTACAHIIGIIIGIVWYGMVASSCVCEWCLCAALECRGNVYTTASEGMMLTHIPYILNVVRTNDDGKWPPLRAHTPEFKLL